MVFTSVLLCGGQIRVVADEALKIGPATGVRRTVAPPSRGHHEELCGLAGRPAMLQNESASVKVNHANPNAGLGHAATELVENALCMHKRNPNQFGFEESRVYSRTQSAAFADHWTARSSTDHAFLWGHSSSNESKFF